MQLRMLGVLQIRYNGQAWQIGGRLTPAEVMEHVRRVREQESSEVVQVLPGRAWDNPGQP